MTVWRLTRTWPDARMQQLALWTAEMMTASEATARGVGTSPQAIVAQAALESGWGAAAIGKNLFGVKAGPSWTGAKRLVWTREVIGGKSVMIQDWFRDYDSYADSVADHFAFLRDNGRYAAAGVFDPDGTKTDVNYFEALKRAGYATDPNYVESLTAVLQTVQNFTRWMEPVDGTAGDAAAPPPRLLFIGMSGPDVSAVQEKLGILADGLFGPVTRQHVIAFQRDHDLDADGIVGPDTRRALGL